MSDLYVNGYVHAMIDDQQSFPEFALHCARAFGALVHMRDDGPDAPITEVIEPSTYSRDGLEQAKAELARLLALSTEQIEAEAAAAKAKSIASINDALARREAQAARCREMYERVQQWSIPSPDHMELKRTMLEWLSPGLNPDKEYWTKERAKAEALTPSAWHTEAIERESRNVTYYTAEWEKEVRRAAERTEWVRLLRDSLKEPEPVA